MNGLAAYAKMVQLGSKVDSHEQVMMTTGAIEGAKLMSLAGGNVIAQREVMMILEQMLEIAEAAEARKERA